MKFTDLTKEQQSHFQDVVTFYADGFPEDATHVDSDLMSDMQGVLLKEDSHGIFFWNYLDDVWEKDTEPAVNFYQVPDKPWYNPDDVAFKPKSRIDVIGQNGNDWEHYDKPTGCNPTGGKSDYYLVEIPLDAPTIEVDNEKGVVRFMLEEYIKYGLGNDFDRGNICKANHRLGNKQGVSVEYDTNKIEHYNNRIRKTFKEV